MKKKLLLCAFLISFIQIPFLVNGSSMTSRDDGPCIGLPGHYPINIKKAVDPTSGTNTNPNPYPTPPSITPEIFMDYYTDYYVYSLLIPQDMIHVPLYLIAHTTGNLNDIIGITRVKFDAHSNTSQIPGLYKSYDHVIFLTNIEQFTVECGAIRQIDYEVTVAMEASDKLSIYKPFDFKVFQTSPYSHLLDYSNSTFTFNSFYNLECFEGQALQTWESSSENEFSYSNSQHFQPINNNLSKEKSLNSIIPNKSELKIFPNPTANTFQVDFFMEEHVEGQIEVFDSNGHLLIREEERYLVGHNTRRFNLEQYPSGLYLVRINNGKHESIHKVLKN